MTGKVKNKEKQTVFVGLSGGVDSAVSAALLQKEGYDVVGLFARIALPGYPCSAGEDRRDALRAAAHLQISFEEIDLSDAYRNKVYDAMIEGYRRGETPNPDALCNREIKFGLLYDFARSRGADFLATGHYARTNPPHPNPLPGKGEGVTHLLKGIDPQKDQSYFLWAVPEDRLAHTLFPVGGLHKPQVRALAQRFGLPNAKRKDSQGLCFLGHVSIDEMLQRELRLASGDVLDEEGSVIGRHDGAALYTIGQRHGFTLSVHSATEVPHYVIAKDMGRNTITVSQTIASQRSDDAHTLRVLLRETNWIGVVEDGPCEARFRYRQPLQNAQLVRERGQAIVVFDTPQAIPVGQSLVLYRGSRCLGGGVATI